MNSRVRFLVIVAILQVLSIAFLFYVAKGKFDRNLQYNFSGVVENVFYDVKGIPTVRVGEKEYYLSAGYDFDNKIGIGDRLLKKSGSNVYVLIKYKTRKVLYFKN